MNTANQRNLNHTNNLSPHCDTHGAAFDLGFSSSTIRVSRVTGTLAGVPAPTYRKVGRKVVYDRIVLEKWMEQFANQQNTTA